MQFSYTELIEFDFCFDKPVVNAPPNAEFEAFHIACCSSTLRASISENH